MQNLTAESDSDSNSGSDSGSDSGLGSGSDSGLGSGSQMRYSFVKDVLTNTGVIRIFAENSLADVNSLRVLFRLEVVVRKFEAHIVVAFVGDVPGVFIVDSRLFEGLLFF